MGENKWRNWGLGVFMVASTYFAPHAAEQNVKHRQDDLEAVAKPERHQDLRDRAAAVAGPARSPEQAEATEKLREAQREWLAAQQERLSHLEDLQDPIRRLTEPEREAGRGPGPAVRPPGPEIPKPYPEQPRQPTAGEVKRKESRLPARNDRRRGRS